MKPSFALGSESTPELGRFLGAAWSRSLTDGTVAYDPTESLRIVAAPFCYHYLPQRAARPRRPETAPPPAGGVLAPHTPCPFDGDAFVAERGLGTLTRDGRSYTLAVNRFPVTSGHFLAIRHATAAPASLPQAMTSVADLEDALLFAATLGDPYRVYFNSNRGGDGSFSGSSVNHWHVQCFPFFDGSPSTLLEEPEVLQTEGPLTIGRTPHWPARHRFVEGPAAAFSDAAAVLWRFVSAAHARDAAYNMEIATLPGNRLRAYFFLRRGAPPREIPDVGFLSPNMGGCELSGHLVLPDEAMFEWTKAQPRAANQCTEQRLTETTRELGTD